jgi:hypothetical protein
MVLFINILFRYNTLFAYTSKNTLTTGIVFGVFLGPDEHLQVFECLVAVVSDKPTSPLFRTSRWLHTFDSKYLATDTRQDMGAIIYNFAFCAAGVYRGEGNLGLNFRF